MSVPAYAVATPSARLGYNRDRLILTPDTVVRGQLTSTSNTTVYTAPTNTSHTSSLGSCLVMLVLANSDSVARTVGAHLVESGGSVAANRLILPTVSIPAGQTTFLAFEGFEGYMEPGEFLNLVAGTANTISYRVMALRVQS